MTLSGRRPTQSQPATASSSKGKEKAEDAKEETKWGTGGQTLGASPSMHIPPSFRGRDLGAGGAAVPQPPSRRKDKQKAKKQKSPSPEFDWGVDDEDVIVIDSD